MRPSSPAQQYACSFINRWTGIPLPDDFTRSFDACHSYIRRYYDNAKQIKAIWPAHRNTQMGMVFEERANEARPQRPRLNLREVMETYAHVTQRDQIEAYAQLAHQAIDTHAAVPHQGLDPADYINSYSRAELDILLQAGIVPMPTGLTYEGPNALNPERVTIRRWTSPLSELRPRPVTEEDLISPPQRLSEFSWPVQYEPEAEVDPDNNPTEEVLKDLIARQFNTKTSPCDGCRYGTYSPYIDACVDCEAEEDSL